MAKWAKTSKRADGPLSASNRGDSSDKVAGFYVDTNKSKSSWFSRFRSKKAKEEIFEPEKPHWKETIPDGHCSACRQYIHDTNAVIHPVCRHRYHDYCVNRYFGASFKQCHYPLCFEHVTEQHFVPARSDHPYVPANNDYSGRGANYNYFSSNSLHPNMGQFQGNHSPDIQQSQAQYHHHRYHGYNSQSHQGHNIPDQRFIDNPQQPQTRPPARGAYNGPSNFSPQQGSPPTDEASRGFIDPRDSAYFSIGHTPKSQLGNSGGSSLERDAPRDTRSWLDPGTSEFQYPSTRGVLPPPLEEPEYPLSVPSPVHFGEMQMPAPIHPIQMQHQSTALQHQPLSSPPIYHWRPDCPKEKGSLILPGAGNRCLCGKG